MARRVLAARPPEASRINEHERLVLEAIIMMVSARKRDRQPI
jgi:hypothetical protein